MKHAMTLILASALAFSGCAQKAEKFALKEGTPAFTLAKDLAAIVPGLGPDKTTVLVETKGFSVTAADVLQAAWDNLGKTLRAAQDPRRREVKGGHRPGRHLLRRAQAPSGRRGGRQDGRPRR